MLSEGFGQGIRVVGQLQLMNSLIKDEMGGPSDAIVIGSGPNGLSAAIVLARAGLSVCVIEAEETAGGGARSMELTLPGFIHDVCSAVHPLAVASPFFRSLDLKSHGLEWIFPPAALAHPFDDGTALLLERSVEDTAARLGPDRRAYAHLMRPLVKSWSLVDEEILGPIGIPRHPWVLARFGLLALRSAKGLIHSRFRGPLASALFAGMAAHAMLPLEKVPSAAFGLVLGMAGHATGWPIPRGGSRSVAAALSSVLDSLGGKMITGRRVRSLDEVPRAKIILCDVTPRQLLDLAGSRLPSSYRRRLEQYRYGMAAYKVDWALDGPIPWKAPECAMAATVHLGGAFEEIAASEIQAWNGQPASRPFVLLAQPSLFDPTRAPAGKHTAWGYCHVPNGSIARMVEPIEAQIERFAPGFRERILGRSVLSPRDLERHNPNLVGGDINGGAHDIFQLFTRPTPSLYRTPAKGIYLCSASTPPGGGVHGMCGYFAARAALKDLASQENICV
jgi:phytoene dehydrogenase-like protein